MKKNFLIGFIILSLGKTALAQSCFVAIDSSRGSYTGECKKGKANGKGKYEWQNGNTYEGDWKNGLFDGFGILTRKTSIDSNTVTGGFWKKGVYIGRYEKPYLTDLLTNNIAEITVTKSNSTVSQISITVKNNSGGASNVRYAVIPKSILSNIQLLGGRYEELKVDTLSRIASRYILRQVTFPFTAILSFDTPGKMITVEQARIEIFETGNWLLNVSLDN